MGAYSRAEVVPLNREVKMPSGNILKNKVNQHHSGTFYLDVDCCIPKCCGVPMTKDHRVTSGTDGITWIEFFWGCSRCGVVIEE